MKPFIAGLAFVTLFSAPVFAQTLGVGALLGASRSMENGFGIDDTETGTELFVSMKIEYLTELMLKVGKVDTVNDQGLGNEEGLFPDGDISYYDLVVAYRFYETYGSTALFAGPGLYRQKLGSFKENDYGFTAGVQGKFPITRRVAAIAEFSYHWAHFDQGREFMNAMGGFHFQF